MGEILSVLNSKLACFLRKGMLSVEISALSCVPVKGESSPRLQVKVTSNYVTAAARVPGRHMDSVDAKAPPEPCLTLPSL